MRSRMYVGNVHFRAECNLRGSEDRQLPLSSPAMKTGDAMKDFQTSPPRVSGECSLFVITSQRSPAHLTVPISAHPMQKNSRTLMRHPN